MTDSLTSPEHLQERLAALEPFGLSGAMLVSRAGDTHFAGACGYADRDAGRPMTPETVSDIGSISKQFTATAAVLLAARGELDLHRPVGDLFPTVPAARAAMTVHQLLNHTAGFEEEHFVTDFDEMTAEEAERRILALPLAAPLGTAYHYSNAGYTLAARVIERVAGQDFRRFVHEHLLQPASLEHTGWYNEAHLGGLAVAHGYSSDHDHGTPFTFPGPMWALLGNGGMLSTVGDLARWVDRLREGTVVDPVWAEKLVTPGLAGYGYGWRVWRDDDGSPVIEHGGASQYGHSALLRRYEALGVTVAIVFNTECAGISMVSVMGDRLASLANGGPRRPAAVAPAIGVDPPVRPGRYRSEEGWLVEIVEDRRGLLIGSLDPEAGPLLAGADVSTEVVRRRQPSLSIARALRDRDTEAVHRLLSPRVRAVTVTRLADAWGVICEAGPMEDIEFAGGEPTRILREVESDLVHVDVVSERMWAAPEPLVSTYLRVRGEGSRRCLRLVWAHDGLAGFENAVADVRWPGEARIAALGDGSAVALDLRTGHQLRIRADGERLWLAAAGRTVQCKLTHGTI